MATSASSSTAPGCTATSNQNETGGEFVENVGVYGDNAPVFRWKHNATISWKKGLWGASFSNKYLSGYVDENDVADAYYHKVRAYSTYSL